MVYIQSLNNMNQQQEISSDPRKKIKRQLTQQMSENKQLFCKCYSQNQVNEIVSAIIGIQNYSKFVSVMIRHQEKSLKTLPESILKMEQFTQLTQRVKKCIDRARVNNDFLQNVIKSYSSQIAESIKAQNTQNLSNQITANSIIHIFVHILREWSDLFNLVKPLQAVMELSQKYINLDTTESKKRIMVQGSGMGRLCFQLNQLLPSNFYLQGCQDRPLHYLCGQFFLKQIRQPTKNYVIFPYIHDFSNKFHTQDFYEHFRVPQYTKLNQMQPQNRQISINFADFQDEYSSNKYNNQWEVVISYKCNERIKNILKWVQIVYKGLKEEGVWIIVCYSSFQKNVIPMTYSQFRHILQKSQFQMVQEMQKREQIISDRGMTKEKLKVHYLVLRK